MVKKYWVVFTKDGDLCRTGRGFGTGKVYSTKSEATKTQKRFDGVLLQIEVEPSEQV